MVRTGHLPGKLSPLFYDPPEVRVSEIRQRFPVTAGVWVPVDAALKKEKWIHPLRETWADLVTRQGSRETGADAVILPG
jgi:hypothetical protein